ncbi:hypothetical protein V8E36_009769 [Tilletia maclaganii]
MALDDLEPYPQAQDFVDRIRRFQPLVHGHNTFVGEGLRKVAKLVKLAYDGFQHRARILSCVERLLRLYEDILHPDSGLDIVSDAPGTPLNLHLQTLESIVAKFGGDIEEHLQPRDRGWIRRLRLNRICAKARLVILAECKAARQSLGLVSRNGKIATRHLEHLQPFDSGLSTAFGVAMRRLDLDPALVDLPQDNKLPVVEYYSAIADLIGSIDFDAVDTHLSRSQSKTPRSLSKIGTDVELCRNFLKDIKKECDPASLHFPTPVAINQWRLVAQGTIELVPLFAEDGHEMRLLQPLLSKDSAYLASPEYTSSDLAARIAAASGSASAAATSSIAKIAANPDESKNLETATAKVFGLSLDFVNLRKEVYEGDTRIPIMSFGTAQEDAERRDITINSLVYNVHTEQVEDLTGKPAQHISPYSSSNIYALAAGQGIDDLTHGIVRTPLPPYQTFLDDPLRVLRCIRFAVLASTTRSARPSSAASRDTHRTSPSSSRKIGG